MANTSFISRVSKRAKVIRKARPNMKWTDAIKAASKELKGGSTKKAGKKVSGSKKSAPTKKRITVSKRTKVTKTISGIGHVAMAGLKGVVGEISRLDKLEETLKNKLQDVPRSERAGIRKQIQNVKNMRTGLKKNKTIYKRFL